MDFPLAPDFFSEAVLERRDAIANTQYSIYTHNNYTVSRTNQDFVEFFNMYLWLLGFEELEKDNSENLIQFYLSMEKIIIV